MNQVNTSATQTFDKLIENQKKNFEHVEVAELVDAHDSGSCGVTAMWVQVPSSTCFIMRLKSLFLVS